MKNFMESEINFQFMKPSLSIPEQVNLLNSRGLIFPNRQEAEFYLKFVSYYRLRAYWEPFLEDDTNSVFGRMHRLFDNRTKA